MPFRITGRSMRTLFIVMVITAGILLTTRFIATPETAASGKDLYTRMHEAVWPSGPAVISSTLYLPSGGRAVKEERQLIPAAKITATHKAPKSKFELQSLDPHTPTLALIEDGGKLWLLTAVGATELEKAPEKARDEAVRLALLLEGDGKEPILAGDETVNGKPVRILDLSYFGLRKRIWVDASSSLPIRAELSGVRYDWVYDAQHAGLIRRIVARDESGMIKLTAYVDPPVLDAKIDDGLFDFKLAKSRVGFLEKVGDALGGKPEVMASAGARGLDPEVKESRSKERGEDYKAVEQMEKGIVTSSDVEEFLREGKLGKYAE